MTAAELRNTLSLQLLAEPDPGREVCGGYAGDLLSWVMGRAQAGQAWVTIMTNVNVIAVASLADVSCVIVAENAAVSDEVVDLAAQKGINLYRSGEKTFELCLGIGKRIGS